MAATLAAWQHCEAWLSAVVAQLDRHRHFLVDSLARDVPNARHHLVEAGYLAWIDFRNLDLGPDFANSKDILCEIITRISHATDENRNPR